MLNQFLPTILRFKYILLFALFFIIGAFNSPSLADQATVNQNSTSKNPNIVLVLMDNLGWGEPGVYGGGVLRGAATPRIDALASEGMRLLNFNVEAQCVPSRASLMTGRYAVRSGNGSVPFFTSTYGLTKWEVTLAEMLSSVGYQTGAFGKWHLGHDDGRYPTDQGFDEWFGIPHSSDESFWPSGDRFRAGAHPSAKPSYVMRAKKGSLAKKIRVYDLQQRAVIDREITKEAIKFIKKSSRKGIPFFAYIPFTMPHYPLLPAPEFKGASRNGAFADVLMQVDHYVGQLLDALKKAGVSDNTIFIFTSDNGGEMFVPAHGFTGPWRGSYFTGLEGSLRVPFIISWPAVIPRGLSSNEVVHQMDIFTTLANLTGGVVPSDRIIDGVDQSPLLLGKSAKSAREGFVVYVGEEIYGIKWRNWKMMTKEVGSGVGSPVKINPVPHFYDLHTDPKEMHPLDARVLEDLWVRFPMTEILKNHLASFKKEPAIKPGTPDPYFPKAN